GRLARLDRERPAAALNSITPGRRKFSLQRIEHEPEVQVAMARELAHEAVGVAAELAEVAQQEYQAAGADYAGQPLEGGPRVGLCRLPHRRDPEGVGRDQLEQPQRRPQAERRAPLVMLGLREHEPAQAVAV